MSDSEADASSFSGEDDNLPSPILNLPNEESQQESSQNLTYTEEESDEETASDEEPPPPPPVVNKKVKGKKVASTPLPAKMSAVHRKRQAEPIQEPSDSGVSKVKMAKSDSNQKKAPAKQSKPAVSVRKRNTTFKEMVIDVLKDNQSRTGLSYRAIEKIAKAKFDLADNKLIFLKKAAKTLVTEDAIYNYKGKGLNGSLKIRNKPTSSGSRNNSKNKSTDKTKKATEKITRASEKTQSKKKAPAKKDEKKKAKPAAQKKAVAKPKLIVNTPTDSVRKSIGSISTKAGRPRRNQTKKT